MVDYKQYTHMEKLLEFQKTVEVIKKDSQNPFFKSNYFDINSLLAEIKPILNELGLIVSQPIVSISENGKNAVRTIIIDAESGVELLSGHFTLPELQDPQKMGSAITYYRRYALQSILALQAEDTDGEIGQHKPVISKTETPKKIDNFKI